MVYRLYLSGPSRSVDKQKEQTINQQNRLEGINKPRRVKHSYTQSIKGTPEQVFPLLCQVRETDWIAGWTIAYEFTSLGPLGALATTPIINHPEVAIVGVNKIQVRPVWNGTQFIPRRMMNLSCSFDHRMVDGMDAATFVQRIRRLLETPALLFIDDRLP